jgi:hypothetical protein
MKLSIASSFAVTAALLAACPPPAEGKEGQGEEPCEEYAVDVSSEDIDGLGGPFDGRLRFPGPNILVPDQERGHVIVGALNGGTGAIRVGRDGLLGGVELSGSFSGGQGGAAARRGSTGDVAIVMADMVLGEAQGFIITADTEKVDAGLLSSAVGNPLPLVVDLGDEVLLGWAEDASAMFTRRVSWDDFLDGDASGGRTSVDFKFFESYSEARAVRLASGTILYVVAAGDVIRAFTSADDSVVLQSNPGVNTVALHAIADGADALVSWITTDGEDAWRYHIVRVVAGGDVEEETNVAIDVGFTPYFTVSVSHLLAAVAGLDAPGQSAVVFPDGSVEELKADVFPSIGNLSVETEGNTAVVAYWHTQSEDRPGLYLKSFCKR